MTRRIVLLFTVVLVSCGTKTKSFEAVLPQQLPGGWNREAVAEPATEVSESIQQLGLEASAQTIYSGPARVIVKVFRMRSPTSAFEVMQRWRQSDGIGLNKGEYFIVAAGPNSAQSMALLRELQKVTV